MITPLSLKKGDKIGIIATARKVSLDDLKVSIDVFKRWGLEVELGKNIFKQDNQFAGTDEQRAEDLQYMLDNPEIKAIIAARGGYGTVRVIDLVDFTNFKNNPKWLVGYSDITALHSHINNNLGIKTIHGVMPLNFPKNTTENEALLTLKKVLFGDRNVYNVSNHKFNRVGKVEGELVGGNLSVLYSLSGTKYDIDTDNKILVLEDLDEYLYHIDRMLMNLKFSGKLEKLKGLIVGGMNDMNDNQIPFGKSAYEIIRDAVKEYEYPVCFNFPVGHIKENFAIVLGNTVELDIKTTTTSFKHY